MLNSDRPSHQMFETARPAQRPIEARATSVAAFVGYFPKGPENDAIRVRQFTDVERTFGGLHPNSATGYALYQFFLNGGSVAFVVRARIGASELAGSPAARSGVHALLDLDPYAFNLLCIPDAARLDENGQRHVYAAATRLCERQRAFLLCDMPEQAISTAEALAWMNGPANPRTSNGAVYFPQLHMPDPLNEGRMRSVPPSGTVAGIIARIDGERGIWKAPAGNDAIARGATPAAMLTDVDSRILNPRAVNAIRTLPSTGTVLWGARTLLGDDVQGSEYKYVPIRRLALYLEQSVHRGLSWVVFEPNGEPLWAQVRSSIESFLYDLYRKGAFQGETPQDACFVRCDRTTMTEADLQADRLVVEIGFAPFKPGEFVIVRIALRASEGAH